MHHVDAVGLVEDDDAFRQRRAGLLKPLERGRQTRFDVRTPAQQPCQRGEDLFPLEAPLRQRVQPGIFEPAMQRGEVIEVMVQQQKQQNHVQPAAAALAPTIGQSTKPAMLASTTPATDCPQSLNTGSSSAR